MTRSGEWAGEIAVLVGGGESVTTGQVRLIGMARSKDLIRVIAINDAVYLCWFADIAYACDARWWRHHGRLPRFPGQKLRLESIGKDGKDTNAVEFPDVGAIANSGTEGFDPDPRFVRTGGNGAYQMVHRAVHMGVKRLILVGIDMQGGHWFGDHPDKISSPSIDFSKRIHEFADLGREVRARGVTVVNASPTSALTFFPKVDLRAELVALEEQHERARAAAPRKGAGQARAGQ